MKTSSRPPTLDFVKPWRRMQWLTPLCSPEHSKTKPSTCTGSRRNIRKAARTQSPVQLSSWTTAGRKTLSEAEGERDAGEDEDKSTEFSFFLRLLSALRPAVIMPLILLTQGSVNCGIWAAGWFKLGSGLFLLKRCGSTYRSPALGSVSICQPALLRGLKTTNYAYKLSLIWRSCHFCTEYCEMNKTLLMSSFK